MIADWFDELFGKEKNQRKTRGRERKRKERERRGRKKGKCARWEITEQRAIDRIEFCSWSMTEESDEFSLARCIVERANCNRDPVNQSNSN